MATTTKKDYYEILGLSEEDKKLQGEEFAKKVKSAHRKLALKWHPDKFAGKDEQERKEAEDKMKEINEAYAVLSDEKKRQQYDFQGSYEGNPFEGFQGTGDPMMDEMIRRHMSNMGWGMGGFSTFGGFGQQSMRVAPTKIRIKIKPSDILNHSSKRIKYKHNVLCSECHGTGHGKDGGYETCPHCGGRGVFSKRGNYGNFFMEQQTVCPHCGGSGQVLKNPCKKCGGTGLQIEEQELTIDIPTGVTPDTYVSYPGMGNISPNNPNMAGDLLVFFQVLEENGWNPVMTRPYDLGKIVEVPIVNCILGGEMETESVTGEKIKFYVPQGARDGDMVTIQGEGLPTTSGRGNAIVEIYHKFPSQIDKDEKELLTRLAKKRNFKN